MARFAENTVFEQPLVLPAAIEEALTNLIYDEAYSEKRILELREILLAHSPWEETPGSTCPDCNGHGLITTHKDDTLMQEGCTLCHGTGRIGYKAGT